MDRVERIEERNHPVNEAGFNIGNYDGKDCDGDDGDTMCTEMFGYDSGYYWSSTPYGSYDDVAWSAKFDIGHVHDDSVIFAHCLRCVRPGP